MELRSVLDNKVQDRNGINHGFRAPAPAFMPEALGRVSSPKASFVKEIIFNKCKQLFSQSD